MRPVNRVLTALGVLAVLAAPVVAGALGAVHRLVDHHHRAPVSLDDGATLASAIAHGHRHDEDEPDHRHDAFRMLDLRTPTPDRSFAPVHGVASDMPSAEAPGLRESLVERPTPPGRDRASPFDFALCCLLL